jgi:hypothetical protein
VSFRTRTFVKTVVNPVTLIFPLCLLHPYHCSRPLRPIPLSLAYRSFRPPLRQMRSPMRQLPSQREKSCSLLGKLRSLLRQAPCLTFR